jgi:hypothetical protein
MTSEAAVAGHPIIFLSSLNFLTRIHRALSALLRKRFLERRVSHLIRTLHLIVTDIRRTFLQSPIIPYPGCRSSVREAPNIVPLEVHVGLYAVDRGPLSPTEWHVAFAYGPALQYLSMAFCTLRVRFGRDHSKTAFIDAL